MNHEATGGNGRGLGGVGWGIAIFAASSTQNGSAVFNVSCHPVHPSVHLINCTPGCGRRGGGFLCSSADMIQVSEGTAGARDREDQRTELWLLNQSEARQSCPQLCLVTSSCRIGQICRVVGSHTCWNLMKNQVLSALWILCLQILTNEECKVSFCL